MKGLTEIPGIRVGHSTNLDALTGCTVVLCEAGAVPGVSIPGSATGTEEIDLLKPGSITNRIHAVCLAGGSAFGLEAASGVRRYLAQKGIGFPTPAGPVPLVTAAILYDLGVARHGIRPNREMGEVAAAAANDGATNHERAAPTTTASTIQSETQAFEYRISKIWPGADRFDKVTGFSPGLSPPGGRR